MDVSLEREMELFRRELPGLLADPATRGRFVLIGGDPPAVAGVYATAEEAVGAGYEKFGLSASFLAKQIVEQEEPRHFSRNIRPCHS